MYVNEADDSYQSSKLAALFNRLPLNSSLSELGYYRSPQLTHSVPRHETEWCK